MPGALSRLIPVVTNPNVPCRAESSLFENPWLRGGMQTSPLPLSVPRLPVRKGTQEPFPGLSWSLGLRLLHLLFFPPLLMPGDTSFQEKHLPASTMESEKCLWAEVVQVLRGPAHSSPGRAESTLPAPLPRGDLTSPCTYWVWCTEASMETPRSGRPTFP